MAFAGSSGGAGRGRSSGGGSAGTADESSGGTTGGGGEAGAARPHTAAWRQTGREAPDEGEAPTRPRGRPFSRRLDLEVDVDWERTGTFGAGVAIGALLGAGLALLLAPHSGADTRRRLRRVGRRAGSRAADAWADLGEELRHATYRTRRKVRRSLRGGGDALGLARRRKERGEEAEDRGLLRRVRRRPVAVEVELD